MTLLSLNILRFAVICCAASVIANTAHAAADLYIKDTALDLGAEPYPGSGPIYLSPDIWVRRVPDPNWDPYPFPTDAPTWTPQPHQNPEFRDPKISRPNYVYVRIHNRGDQPSSGTERLRLYQAKAGTGLAWPAQWVDNVDNFCAADQLMGIEVTKPRRNAKDVSPAEREAYREALIALQSDASLRYSDGVQYWRKQSVVHDIGGAEHGVPAFLPWHREYLSRLESRMREANPLITLLYWDFTEHPTAGVNLMTTAFMGAGNGVVANPLTPLRPPTLTRNVGGSTLNCGGSRFESDATFLAESDYRDLALAIERAPNHDCAHGYIGGYSESAGQISFLNTAAEDPMFFLLHGNVDRQWATWQRSGAGPERLDPAVTYGSVTSDSSINTSFGPWDGTSDLPNMSIQPWSPPNITPKDGKDRSIVYPPIYDTAPLNIPVLDPGESIVIELPWYPPNVNEYNCSGQAGHFCLLARIETETGGNFGMTFAEGTNVSTNTRNNNNIAWKNLTIVDDEPDVGPFLLTTGTIIRNIFDRPLPFEITLVDRTVKRRFLLQEFANLSLRIPREVFERIREAGGKPRNLKVVDRDEKRGVILQITGKEPGFSVMLKPKETFVAEFMVDARDRKLPDELFREPFHFDIEQRIDLPDKFFDRRGAERPTEVGGVRFTVDFAELRRQQRERDKGPILADLQLNLTTPDRKRFTNVDQPARSQDAQHVTVGEPLQVDVLDDDPAAAPMRSMTLEIDGEVVERAERGGKISRSIVFDQPGVHILTTRGISENGELVTRRVRVLVTDGIPPNVMITNLRGRITAKVGEEIKVIAEAASSYGTEIKSVALYAKEGNAFATGMNLVRSGNFDPIDQRDGEGPHSFEFVPEKAGMYMLQVGAFDTNKQVGVSNHLMIMVE